MRILVVNAGSTSLKLHVVDGDAAETVDTVEAAAGVDAVAHRVVHGGPRYRTPVLIDDDVLGAVAVATPLAPLHNAPALDGIADARRALPDVPHVAVFDTGFHAQLPASASTYAVPRRWRDEWGVARYGFHGLSVAWAVGRAADLLAARRIIVCHLGGGSSITGVVDGRSVDTTMGFTPMDGVPMTSRSGAIDPGIVLHGLRRGVSVDELDRALEHESGLLALSERTGHVGELELAAAAGDERAALALDVYTLRVAGAAAAMTASVGIPDAVVFTAGIGERSALVREGVSDRLTAIGLELDHSANARAEPDCDVATGASRVRALVIRAREELVAARLAHELLERVR